MSKFNDIYSEVLKKSRKELEKLRNQYLFELIFKCGIVFVLYLMFCIFTMEHDKTADKDTYIILGLLVIYAWYHIIKKMKRSSSYRLEYKRRVIKEFVESYNENLIYDPFGKISESDYTIGFGWDFNVYASEDLIIGKIDNYPIEIGEVHTERYNQKNNNTVFRGTFAHIKLNNYFNNGRIKIISNGIDWNGELKSYEYDDNKIEIDSQEFEKYFDVIAVDKIAAMQLLTSEVIEELLKFRARTKMKFEIIIANNHLYIRYYNGDIFEANVFKSSVDFDTLKKVYDIIDFTFIITKFFIKINEEIEI